MFDEVAGSYINLGLTGVDDLADVRHRGAYTRTTLRIVMQGARSAPSQAQLESLRSVMGPTLTAEVATAALRRTGGDVAAAILYLTEENERYSTDALSTTLRQMGVASDAQMRSHSRPTDSYTVAKPSQRSGGMRASALPIQDARRNVSKSGSIGTSRSTSEGALLHLDEAAAALRDVFPELSASDAMFAVKRHNGDVAAAAEYTMTDAFKNDLTAASAMEARTVSAAAAPRATATASPASAVEELDARERAALKQRLLARYDEAPDTSDKTYAPKIAWERETDKRSSKREIRYRDGAAVWTKKGARHWQCKHVKVCGVPCAVLQGDVHCDVPFKDNCNTVCIR